MHRRVLPVLLVLLVSLAPAAAAQAPPAPDPEAVVALACGLDRTVGEALPVCPREEPAAPQPAEAPAHAHEEPAPQAVDAFAAEAVETVEEVAEDPEKAPTLLVGLVATVLQFVRDLVGGVAAAVATGGEAMVASAWAIADDVGSRVTAAGSRGATFVADSADALADAARAVSDAALRFVAAASELWAGPSVPEAGRVADREGVPDLVRREADVAWLVEQVQV